MENSKMEDNTEKKEKLEKIVDLARSKSRKIVDDVKNRNRTDYMAIERELNKHFKAVQWYAQRSDLSNNEKYIDYSIAAIDLMEEVYDKLNPNSEGK